MGRLYSTLLLGLLCTACVRDDWSPARLLPDDDVPDAADAHAPPDVADDLPLDGPPTPTVFIRGGITPLGPVSNGSITITGGFEFIAPTCSSDRSICITGGISP